MSRRPSCGAHDMLSIGAMSGDQAGYYLSLAREDYYLEGGEPPGRWYGRGSRELNLEGLVQADELQNLFAGYAPDGSHSLVQRQRKSESATHRPGWDLTFSAPKSVSVLWATGDQDLRFAIEHAHRQAVEAALDFLEGEAVVTRRGQNGKVSEKVGMVAACFDHSTSRALDPQLHTHALLLNVGVRADGTTGTVSAYQVFQCKMLAGALYRAELANQLIESLHLPVQRDRFAFKVIGVPDEVVNFYSKRREEMQAELQRKGLTSAKAAAMVAIQTRGEKSLVSRPELFEHWKQECEPFGWNSGQAESLVGTQEPVRDHQSLVDHAQRATLDELMDNVAHFTRRDYLQRLAVSLQPIGVSASEVVRLGTTFLNRSKEVVPLGPIEGIERYTTPGMFECEKKLLEHAEALHGNSFHKLVGRHVEEFLAKDADLSDEQQDAVRHTARGSGGIAVISGMAGTGKTKLLSSLKELYESQGFEVSGACLMGRTSRQLREQTGIATSTVAQLLWKLDPDQQRQEIHRRAGAIAADLGPDVLEPLRKLADAYGPDILDPVRKLADRYGPNILAPITEFADRYGPNIMEPVEKLLQSYGPDIGQLWRTLGQQVVAAIESGRTKKILSDKSVLVIDEAGMLSTPHMEKLARHVNESGAKLVLVGDAGQTKPIGPGAPFPELGEKFGQATLKNIKRQHEQWEREAIQATAAGNVRESLKAYGEHDRIFLAETQSDSMDELVRRWGEDRDLPGASVIIASTHSEVNKLNEKVQQLRQRLGELGEAELKHENQAFHVNDCVLFTKPSRARGIENGMPAEVLAVDPEDRLLTVRLETGKKLTVALDEFPSVKLGYAVTTHYAQGMTVDRAYVQLGGQMQDRAISYVQTSRARDATYLYAVKGEEGDELEQLARDMERNRENQMAHTILRQGIRMRM